MNRVKARNLVILFLLLFCTLSLPLNTLATDKLSEDRISKIESFIKKQMKEGKIPGISVVIVNGDETIYEKGFGYAELKTKRPVTSETLFELGSTSKAFTGLGVLQLQSKGLIKLSDPVGKYLPWFKVKYIGEYGDKKVDSYVEITLEQLLHHTSGIPFKSIGDIPIADGDNALEETIKALIDTKLDFYPGEKFQYTTINYDILGLIIQQVSGIPFEEYMKKNILQPLRLSSTYVFGQEAALHDMAVGYKVGFLRPMEFNAPIYRGNTPAGYFITNAQDMAKWLKIQLQTDIPSGFDRNLIDQSHIPDHTVAPGGDASSYACGWSIFQKGNGEISHSGNNPNFASYIVFRPGEKLGVAVLANMNSAYVQNIGQGICDILISKKPVKFVSDMYQNIDNAATVIICITIPLFLITLYYLLFSLIQFFRRQRKLQGSITGILVKLSFLVLFLAGVGYCFYHIPDVLYWGLAWSFVRVWAPQSFITAIISLFSAITLFGIYYLFTNTFQKANDKALFPTIILSIVSGFGNALIIFIINEALNRTDEFQGGLLLFFIMGIIVYIFGQRLVRTRLITLTNELVYSKRVELTNKILNASFQEFETIESGKIYASLNNDTETISNFANIIITGFTNLVTLACCFVYLGIINFFGLLISILAIFISASLYYFVSKSANRLWEQTRDIQNIFFKFINDLINGFKELVIHNLKRDEFEQDMKNSCRIYKDKRTKADLKFTNVFVVGELLFTFVIGVAAFVFPILFKEIQNSSLRNYIFVFLYMTGPVRAILNTIPNAVQVKISWNRLNALANQLNTIKLEQQKTGCVDEDSIELQIKGIEYKYKNKESESFSVGPVSFMFKSGEIVFITGGNGSGKSTLAKLITGLYVPDSGEILLNGESIDSRRLSQRYSTVFSDFYLFDKLYGVDCTSKLKDIEKYLKILQLDDKLQIDNRAFTTIKLSTGQRKRLALLVSYLEDRPIYLFDEWAADQDPEFRMFFYCNLLTELKNKGKCVIVITHDDRYFNIADRLIKMEMGKIENINLTM
ncbi:MAG: cyclic peptide export ABC transporter [Ruminiclostridium sp.]|nr:cyclic peptide export ABC transporter [Ruminiclostridium sp.]